MKGKSGIGLKVVKANVVGVEGDHHIVIGGGGIINISGDKGGESADEVSEKSSPGGSEAEKV